MKAAIYSRKSKFTGKGESVENQIQLCKEYGQNNLRISEFYIYEDEGFSGKNLDRPEFQKLLRDAKAKKFDVLICYRLDRISRNIADFSTLINELQKLSVDFVSIREQFDTSTPMGRAMMYIASVFAQLERETIAERVRDNMLELSKTGRWLGGPAPFGFRSERIIEEGKEVTYLVPEKKELNIVKEVYEKYIEFKSLYKLNKYLTNTYSSIGKRWTDGNLSLILQNPVFCKSNSHVKEYLELQGITVIGDMLGKGLVLYNKHNTDFTLKDKSEWICAEGKHDGIIEGDMWVKVQNTIKNNSKIRNSGKSKISILSGLLRCSECGAPMNISYANNKKLEIKYTYYKCKTKNLLGVGKCQNPNANLVELETAVIEKLKVIAADKEAFISEFTAFQEVAATSNSENEIRKIKNTIAKNEQAISNLVKQLSILSVEASAYVSAELDRISKENISLKNKLLELEERIDNQDAKHLNIELFYETLRRFPSAIKMATTVEEKRLLINSVVKSITWNGFNNDVQIKLFEVE